jgi:group I intron endonuclease
VGQTRNSLHKRWALHKSDSRRFSSNFFHSAIKKYGSEVFSIEEIDLAESLEELNIKEIFYIRQFNTLAPNGYNLTEGGEGLHISEQTRAKLSKASLGRKHTDEAKRKISEASLGRKHTQEAKQKMSSANLGKKLSEETRLKISVARTLDFCHNGHQLTEENLYLKSGGKKQCKQCVKDWCNHRRARLLLEKVA